MVSRPPKKLFTRRDTYKGKKTGKELTGRKKSKQGEKKLQNEGKTALRMERKRGRLGSKETEEAKHCNFFNLVFKIWL